MVKNDYKDAFFMPDITLWYVLTFHLRNPEQKPTAMYIAGECRKKMLNTNHRQQWKSWGQFLWGTRVKNVDPG